MKIRKSHDGKTIIVSLNPESVSAVTQLTDEEALSLVLAGMCGDETSVQAAQALTTINSPHVFCQALREVAKASPIADELREAFHSQWTVRSHLIREVFGDDQLLADILRLALPSYIGPGLTIYRGEQAARFAQGQIGFNWSASRRVAEVFASGLCATYPGGGVLLQACASPAAFISGPSPHSAYLGENELIVDPRQIQRVTKLAHYPEMK